MKVITQAPTPGAPGRWGRKGSGARVLVFVAEGREKGHGRHYESGRKAA